MVWLQAMIEMSKLRVPQRANAVWLKAHLCDMELQLFRRGAYQSPEIWVQTQQRENPGYQKESFQAKHIVR